MPCYFPCSVALFVLLTLLSLADAGDGDDDSANATASPCIDGWRNSTDMIQ